MPRRHILDWRNVAAYFDYTDPRDERRRQQLEGRQYVAGFEGGRQRRHRTPMERYRQDHVQHWIDTGYWNPRVPPPQGLGRDGGRLQHWVNYGYWPNY